MLPLNGRGRSDNTGYIIALDLPASSDLDLVPAATAVGRRQVNLRVVICPHKAIHIQSKNKTKYI